MSRGRPPGKGVGARVTSVMDPRLVRNQPITLQQLVLDLLSQFFFITPQVLRSKVPDDWDVITAYILGINSLLAPYLDSWSPEYKEKMVVLKQQLDDPRVFRNRKEFIKLVYGSLLEAIIREFGNPDIAMLPVPRKTIEF